MIKIACITSLCVLLAGCGNRLSEIKDAVSGINSAAETAASAVGRDVHAIRAIAIDYKDTSFTVNDLFKTILRDVRWDYDAEKSELHVRGTWQAPLFSEQQWDDTMKKQLAETGVVKIKCTIKDDKIDSALTNVTLIFNDETILKMNGEDALHHLYDTYLQK
ncbi:hypothetical protein [Lysinibacillus sp. BPa_S21]|uniref:hypothetical protein n=1 Tax=Lysinibacillus sp. BPa_S21 TaxID=2932478 RepID=UPI0020122F08|nr:hypothetical protein [Lysinibacillus sp. BPa_S21]MCL1695924.1 hypothetical protein [Lysinibacillus sp. BPa_S21]